MNTSNGFQAKVYEWLFTCFGEEISHDKIERNHRFLEEALELVQSLGCTKYEAAQLLDYVFDRPIGEPEQETGCVLVTLAALCSASNIDMQNCGETELTRVWGKIEKIREKQANKPKHSPLPQPIVVDKENEENDKQKTGIYNFINKDDERIKELLEKEPVNFFLVNILRCLSPENMKILSDNLIARLPKKDISDKELEYNKTYVDGLTRNYGTGAPNDYQYTGPRCIKNGCKRYVAYETHHHKDCPFYPGSMSERYDNLLASSIPIIDKGDGGK